MTFGIAEAAKLRLPESSGAYLWLLAIVIVALTETFHPRRQLAVPTARRWANNAILGLLGNSPANWIFSAAAVVVAAQVRTSSYGLLNRDILPLWLRCILSVLLLDLIRYAQHRLYHAFSMLWRIHRVHHSDPEFDCSTSLLFHPAEVLLTQGTYLAAIAILAPPPLAVLGLELATIVLNIFEHGNLAVPKRLDAWLRRLLVTPDMHRIHHSDAPTEQNTNFGTVFPWWDRLFGTYLQEPAAGHEKMGIGLRELPDGQSLNALRMLALPFRRLPTGEAVEVALAPPSD